MTMEPKANDLLVWLHTEAKGIIGRELDPLGTPRWSDLREEELHTLVRWLERQGYVKVFGEADTRTSSALTVRGIDRAEELIRRSSGPVARTNAAMNGLVAAAMDDFPVCRVGVAAFALSPRAALDDSRLDITEIERAAEYLVKAGLAVRRHIGSAPWGAVKDPTFELTVLGMRCGERSPLDVRNFVSEQHAQQVTFTFNGPTQVGNHNTRHNTFGHDHGELARFARELLSVANGADITDTARARITDSVEALERELTSTVPEPGRLRQFFEEARQAALQNLPTLTLQALFAAMGIPA
ncbi:hypothetical protein ACWCPT_08400 [Streptomyces sp. NPDC002308]